MCSILYVIIRSFALLNKHSTPLIMITESCRLFEQTHSSDSGLKATFRKPVFHIIYCWLIQL